jgi:prepilin-type N-terminal cleavage/methylation domain-containing protein
MKCADIRLQTSDFGGSRKLERGFTLYEVIIVLIVLLLVSAVVVPSFSGFLPAVRVRKAGDELLAAFSKARADSVLTSRRFRVVFTKNPAAYRIEFEPDPMNSPATFRRLSGEWGADNELPEGVTFSTIEGTEPDSETTEDCLEFSTDGTAPGAKIVLEHEGGDQVTIEINPADGRARVVDPDEESP